MFGTVLSRRRLYWLTAVVALVFGGILTLWAKESVRLGRATDAEPQHVTATPTIIDSRPPALRPAPSTVPAVPSSARADTTPSTEETRAQFRVLSEQDGTPIPRATVALGAGDPTFPEVPLVSPRQKRGSGVTSEVGEVAFSVARGEDLFAHVSARGFSAAFVKRVALDGTNVVILALAPSISGTVRSNDGRPVADIEIRAWPAALGNRIVDDSSGIVGGPTPLFPLESAKTDASGRFSVPASSDRPHLVRLASGDWGIVHADNASGAAERILADPRGGEVEFVVEPLRVVAIRLVDRETSVPQRVAAGFATPTFDSDIVRVHSIPYSWRLPVGGDALASSSDEATPDVMRFLLRLNPSAAGAERIQLSLNLPGFRALRSDVRLLRPSRSDSATAVDDIQVEHIGLGGRGTATLIVNGVSAPAGLDIGPRAMALVQMDHGRGTAAVGRKIAPGRWEFVNLPTGKATVRVTAGYYSQSDVIATPLEAGKTAEATAHYSERGWVSFDLRSADGGRIANAAVVTLFTKVGGRIGRALPMSHDLLDVSIDGGGDLARPALYLEPGEYTLSVRKAGFRPGGADFRVEKGVAQTVVVSLTPGDDRR